MEEFIATVYIISALLSLILFFKIWAMTNHISEICNELGGFKQIFLDSIFGNSSLKGKKPGDKVVYRKDVQEYIVNSVSFTNGTYCLNLQKGDKFHSKVPHYDVLTLEEDQILRKSIIPMAKFRVFDEYYGDQVLEIIKEPDKDGICIVQNSNNKKFKIKYIQ